MLIALRKKENKLEVSKAQELAVESTSYRNLGNKSSYLCPVLGWPSKILWINSIDKNLIKMHIKFIM